MKNLKKVLALALAFVMCFTMFAGAAVYTDVPAGSDYSEAITLLSDLGIIAGKPDGSYGVNDAITRADAACLIARLMTGETVPSKYAGASNFTDVSKDAYYESAVAYCAIMGITSGTGNGQYSPLRTITDGEFIAMVTRALGYDTAENPLQFPMGNIAIAQQKGLLDGVNVVAGSDALRGEDAQVLYNALFADYDRYTKANNIYQGSVLDTDHDDPYTIAEVVYGLGKLAYAKPDGSRNYEIDFYGSNDDITCTNHTWVVAGVDARDGDNEYLAYAIADKDTSLDSAKKVVFSYDGDADSILGYQVELWGDMDHTGDEFEVVAIKTVKGQTSVDWNASMGVDGKKVKYNDGDDKMSVEGAALATINLDSDSIFTNTKKTDAYTLTTLKKAEGSVLETKDGSIYRIVDWDSDDTADFLVVDTVKYAEVKSMTNKKIGLESLNPTKGYTLALDDDNLVVEGVDDIEKGDIVEIAVVDRSWTKSDDEIVTISLTAVDSEIAELTKVSTKKAAAYYDDEPIEKADSNFWDAIGYADEERGNTYELWLNRNGYLIKSDESDSSSKGYLMILDTGKGSTATNNRKLATVDVMLDSGEYVEDMPVVASLKVQDIDKKTISGAYDEDTRSFDEAAVVGQVFKYYTNDDDQITKLIEATDIFSADDDYSYVEKTDRLTADNLTGAYGLKDSDVIFMVSQGAIVYDVKNDQNVEIYSGANLTIDEDDVAVLAVEDLEDIADGEDMEPGSSLYADEVKNDEWDIVWPGKAVDVTVALSADSNRDVDVAILSVKDVDAFKSSTKVALITDVDWTSGDDAILYGAIDGKVDADWTATDVDELNDVFGGDSANLNLPNGSKIGVLTDYIGRGKYAEVTFYKDGEVKSVNFMTYNANTDSYRGNKYEVVRTIVGNTVKDSYFTYMSEGTAIFADDENFYQIEAKSDRNYYNVDDDTVFYTIDGTPTVLKAGTVKTEVSDYDGIELSISNLFAGDELDITAEKSLTASINDNADWDGDYVVVDVALDKDDAGDTDVDAVAVFAFSDIMNELEAVLRVSPSTLTFTYGEDEDTEKTSQVLPKDATEVTVEGEHDGLTASVEDNVITVEYTDAAAGTYVYVVTGKDASGKTLDSVKLTVVVEKADAKIDSALYNNGVVKIVLDSEDAAKEVADKPELITIMKGATQIVGTATRQGTVDTKAILVKVDMSNITSTDPVTVKIADTDNFKITNKTAVEAGYQESDLSYN